MNHRRQRQGHSGASYAFARPGQGNRGFAGNGQGVVSSGISCNTASPLARAACDVTPAPCGVDVLGSTSMVTNPTGIAAGAPATLTVTAGDSCQFQALAAYVAAYEFQGATTIANANRLPLLLTRLDIGNVSALRRLGGIGSGIITDPYNAQQGSVMAIRTGPFSSTNEQNMTWVFLNVNFVLTHVYLDVWGFSIN